MTGAGPRYRILRRLGQGGMAEVFEAELVGDHGFVRRVAIKRMLGDAAADPSAAHRFLDEARIASRLHHANVVSVVDLGLLDNLPFQVLELVEGINAQQLLHRAGGTLPLEVALAIVGEVAHGLDHAHSACDANGHPLEIVHRDVKPSNVLVSWGGDVKLSDFGIAVARDRAAQTEAGLVPGTAGFIAPEQRMKSEMDGRTDVFALGLTLHALITGYTPLQDVTVEIAVLEGEPMPLDESLPADVRQLIARAVTPSRLDRLTAAQLADGIGGVLAPRLTRDARSLLRGYLGGLDRKPAPKAGAFDQLLGIDVVLADAGEDGVRRYATIASPAARPDDPTRAGAGAPTVQSRPDRVTVSSAAASSEAPTKLALAAPDVQRTTGRDDPAVPRRSRALPVALASAALLAIGGVATWQVIRTSRAPDAEVAGPEPGDAPRPVDPDAAPIVVGVNHRAPIAATSPPDPEVRIVIDAGVARDASVPARAPRDASRRTSSDAGTVARTADEAGIGYVQVTGEDMIGARVIIDGKPAGFAPNKLEVTIGHHRIEIARADGTRLPAKDLEVTSFHTLNRPARPTW